MSEIQSLPAALRRQAAADPESPFLFWPDGWNGRWGSWREAAELAARWSAPLAGLPPACGVAVPGAARPAARALHLPVQSAGLRPGHASPRGCARGGGGAGWGAGAGRGWGWGGVRGAGRRVFRAPAGGGAALGRGGGGARGPRRWRRLPVPPLGRLRTLFQSEPPAPDDAAFWRE